MIIQTWRDVFINARWPADEYFVFDTETTGLNAAADAICTAALLRFSHGELILQKEYVCNWLDAYYFDTATLCGRLIDLEEKMLEKTGTQIQHTAEYLRANGGDPYAVLAELCADISTAVEHGIPIIMHNGVRFDIPMLLQNAAVVGIRPPTFSLVYDTGAIEKAAGLFERAAAASGAPGEAWPVGDDAHRWASRVLSLFAPGIPWSLHGHCVPKYGLQDFMTLNALTPHTATGDCKLVNAVFLAQLERAIPFIISD